MLRDVQRAAELDVARHHRVGEGLQGLQTQQGQHFSHIGFRGAEMTMHENVGWV